MPQPTGWVSRDLPSASPSAGWKTHAAWRWSIAQPAACQLTEAGRRLRANIERPVTDIALSLQNLSDHSSPQGHLKIAATSIAEPFLSGPLLASFTADHPDITLDITVTDEDCDIIEAGFDAGVRLGDVIEQDMIAVPLGGDQRDAVVATPDYWDSAGRPEHPKDLVHHRCIGWRPRPDIAPYRWEFSQDGHDFSVAVAPQTTTNDLTLMTRMALAGGGVTFALFDTFRPHIDAGRLEPVLQDFLPPFAGFFLYFPSRRNMPAKLRALADHLRRNRWT